MVCIAQAIARAHLGYDCQLIGYPQNFAAPWAARVLMGSIWRFAPQFASKTIQQAAFLEVCPKLHLCRAIADRALLTPTQCQGIELLGQTEKLGPGRRMQWRYGMADIVGFDNAAFDHDGFAGAQPALPILEID